MLEGKGVTNLLLAVIAGVLLFGKDAVAGGLQSAAILIAVIFVIYLIILAVGTALRPILESYRDAKNVKEVILLTFGFFALLMLASLFVFSSWLWFQGVKNPFDATMDTWIGTAWVGVLSALIGGFLLLAAKTVFVWLLANWHDWRSYLRLGVGYLTGLITAPLMFPVREWQFKRAEGAGIVSTLLSCVYVCLVGFSLWILLLIAVIFVLLIIGLVE